MNARTVLVVDDDLAMRDMLVALLEEGGAVVRAASSAGEALEAVRSAEFDAVVSDIQMPGTTGLQLVEELHRLRPSIPVVLMTAFGSPELVAEALETGAAEYLAKPFRGRELWAALDRVRARGNGRESAWRPDAHSTTRRRPDFD